MMDFVTKVFEAFVDWAKNKGRWPLLLLVLAIPAVLGIGWWKGLELREALLDDSAWLTVALIMLLSGILLVFTLQSARRVRWLSSIALLIPALILGVFAVAPPLPPPEGTIVIAVARFTSVDPDDRRDARIVSHQIARQLEDEAEKHSAKWVVRRLRREVVPENPVDMRAAAIEIAGARHVNAHLIVWGEVVKDGNSLRIDANTAIARPFGRRVDEPARVRMTSDEPTSLHFKEEVAERIVSGVAGLIHLASGEYDKAVPDLTQSGSNADRLARGLALYEQSLLQQESRVTLIRAIAAYDSVLRSPAASAGTQETLWFARVNMAAAQVALARGSTPDLAEDRLESAIGLYRLALESRPKAEWKEDWPRLQHGLGIALSDLGETIEGDSGTVLLRAAVAAYDSALGAYEDGKHVQQYAAVLNTRAAALTELGRSIPSSEGDALLGEAVAAYRMVLAMSGSAWRRAGTQTNLGAALIDLGRRAEGETARRHFRQAVSTLQAALAVTDSVQPGHRAIMTENLAAALSVLAETTSGEQRNQLLIEAGRYFREARRIYASIDQQVPQVELQDSIEAVQRRLGE